MFRFIGGPARCGKTTLTEKAQQQHHGQLLSLDNLRRSFIAVGSAQYCADIQPDAGIEDHTIAAWLDLMRSRDRAMWLGAKAYLEGATELQDNVLMEGCLWPDYVAELDVPYRAVYVVDTSPEHVNRVMHAARSESTHNNWMRNRSDEWLQKWATYNVARSQLYVRLAHECQQPVLDVADGGFEQAQASALDHLFRA